MKIIRLFIFFSSVGSLLIMPASLQAGTFDQVEITQIFKDVKTLEHSGSRPAVLNETIRGEQSVKTAVQSRAELMFSDRSLTRLGANTIFSFQQGTRELELRQGTILFQVPKGAGGANIRTAAVTAAITGTTGFNEYSPKAGLGGIIKFGILEGEATLFINGHRDRFIHVGPGEMVVLPDRPADFNSTEVFHFDIWRFLQTAPLITKMGGLPKGAQALVMRAADAQARMLASGNELFRTNVMLPSTGLKASLFAPWVIDQRLAADNPLRPMTARSVAANVPAKIFVLPPTTTTPSPPARKPKDPNKP